MKQKSAIASSFSNKDPYKQIHLEAERRKKVDEDYEAQGALIGAAEMNKLQGIGNSQFDKLYNELLSQIKDMLSSIFFLCLA